MERLEDILGTALRRVRKERGLTQEAVAAQLDISTEFYGRVERGRACPSLGTFIDIVDLFDISADELLGRTASGESGRGLAYFMDPGDPPVVRRQVQRFRQAPPEVVRALTVMLNLLEHPERQGRSRSGAKESK